MTESTAFKDIMSPSLVKQIAANLKAVQPGFPVARFVKQITPQLPDLELKGRVGAIRTAMRDHLPGEYPDALALMLKSMDIPFAPDFRHPGFFFYPHAEFVEHYGLDHFEDSMAAIYTITKRFTGEFAIRPYLVAEPKRTLAVLDEWTRDPSEDVRRLVSEGTRTRLPWSSRLPQFIEDPKPVLRLLEKLKADASLYVRRSVANNLNDITKDHPDLVVERLSKWNRTAGKETKWLIRHALRSEIKAGNPKALSLLGFSAPEVSVKDFAVRPRSIALGEPFSFSFSLRNKSKEPQALLIDFALHLLKANGERKPKVFKYTKVKLAGGEVRTFEKNVTLRPISTRKYYAGEQEVELLVNGESFGRQGFEIQEG